MRGCARTRLRTRARINRAKSTGVIFFSPCFSLIGVQGGFSLFIPLFFEAEKGAVDNFPPVDNFAAVFILHLAFRRRGLGFGAELQL